MKGVSIFLNANINQTGMVDALKAMEKESAGKVNHWQVTLPLTMTMTRRHSHN